MKARGRRLVCVLIALGSFGCTSHEIHSLNPGSIETYRAQKTVEGFTIAAKPFSEKEEVMEAFTLDLTEEGYVPVLLVFDNRSGDGILLTRDDIELIDSRGNVSSPVSADIVVESFEHDKMAYALLGFGIFSYMSADEANDKMLSDWREKQLPVEKVVRPKRKSHGVVYFKLGQNVAALPNSTLNVPFMNVKTGEEHTVQLRLQ